MAERQTQIVVGFEAGPDNLTPQLARQRAEAERLAAATRDAKAQLETARPAGPPSPTVQPPPGTAAPRVTVVPPAPAPGAAAPAPPGQSQLAERRLSGGATVSAVAGLLSGNVQQAGSALSSVGGTIGKIATGFGVAGVAIGAVAGLVTALTAAFQRFRPSIQEVVEEIELARGRLERARSGGTTAEDVRRSLGPAFAGEIQRLQRTGNDPQQITQLLQARLAREEARLSQVQGRNLGEQQAGAEQALQELQSQFRQGTRLVNQDQGVENMVRARAAFAEAGLGDRAEVRAMFEQIQTGTRGGTFTQMRPEQITALTRLIGEAETGARANVQTLQGVLRTGMLGSLAPGAVAPTSAPGFTSRQVDVLDLHNLIQQDAVRDQAEQQRFDAQMAAWEEWNRQLRTILTGGVVS